MFEREIKFIYDFNLNKVNRLGPYFTFEQLASSGVHPAILHYISAEIDYLIFEDRQQLLKNSVFDYSGEKISLLFSQISDEVKHTKRFSLEYVSKLILHASSFTVNFLVRPKWSLVKFVFDEGDHKTTSEIKQILNYLYYYKHLKSILISYITTKKILSMNSDEFKELLNKVDQLGVETYLPSILTGALKSMAEFFNIGEVQKNRIPLVAMQMFLEEKQLTKHLDKLHSVFGEDGNMKFNMNEYQKEFDSVLVEKEEAIPEETENVIFEPVIVEQHDFESEEIVEAKDETVPVNMEKQEIIEEGIGEDQEEKHDESYEEPETVKEEMPDRSCKPVKIRINVKDDNKIERIDEDELKNNDVNDEENVEDEKQNTFFDNYEDNTVNGEIDEAGKVDEEEKNVEQDSSEQESEQKEVEQFDKTAGEIESTLDYDNNKYEDFLEDDETKEINKYADETLKNIEKELNVDEKEENESMLKSILNNESDDKLEENEEKDLRDIAPSKEQNFSKTDLPELLEHKEMTKIIETVFEYDIEEFSNTLEEIMVCTDVEEAHIIINNVLKERGFRRKSKEAQLFKQIISEYFNRR